MKKLCVPEEVLIEIVNALEQGLSAQDIIQQYEFSEEHRACWRLPGLESSNDTENNTLIHLQSETRKLQQIIDELNLENRILRWMITKIISPDRPKD